MQLQNTRRRSLPGHPVTTPAAAACNNNLQNSPADPLDKLPAFFCQQRFINRLNPQTGTACLQALQVLLPVTHHTILHRNRLKQTITVEQAAIG